MFGEALHDEALGLAGFEHFAHGVAGMGMIGMGMEIDAYHGRSLLLEDGGMACEAGYSGI